MARPSLKAQFFVASDGCVTEKAAPLSIAQRRAAYERDGRKCQRCKRPVKFGGTTTGPFETHISGQIDHVFPRARGGQNDPSNLQLLCLTCNSQKGTS